MLFVSFWRYFVVREVNMSMREMVNVDGSVVKIKNNGLVVGGR